MEELQSPPEPSSTDITSNKGKKKKPPAKEKKEPEKRAKKKTPVTATVVTATTSTEVNKHQSTARLDDVVPEVKVSEFDPCVENHFRAMDAIVELCCEAEDGDGGIDESDIQRFSSSTIFLRYSMVAFYYLNVRLIVEDFVVCAWHAMY